MTKPLCLACAIIASCAAGAAAQTVEVVVVAEGLDAAASGAELAESLTEGCLEALFDLGVIGTNARPLAGTEADFLGFGPRHPSVGESVDLVLVVYARLATGDKAAIPLRCAFRLVGSDGKALASGEAPRVEALSAALDDILAACRSAGSAAARAAFGSM